MNISNQLAEAMTSYLQGLTFTGTPTINTSLTADLNTEEGSRIVVVGNQSNLYKTSLPGIYRIDGSVNIIQSVDEASGAETFNTLCEEMESAIGGKTEMIDNLQTEDSELHIYTYNFMGSSIAAADRQFMCSYQFEIIARNHDNTTT